MDGIYILECGGIGLTARLRKILSRRHGIDRLIPLSRVRLLHSFPETFGPKPTFLWQLKNRPPHTNLPVPLKRYFLEQEWRNALLPLSRFFPGRVINDPMNSQLAHAKTWQLEVAKRCDLKIPRTLVTNDLHSLHEFARQEPASRIVLKPLDTTWTANPYRPDDPVRIGPKLVTAAQIAKWDEQALRESPVIAQEEISKTFELRVVIFGAFACFIRIDSQSHALSHLDWRRRQSDRSMFSWIAADKVITHSLIRYLRAAGLHSGVFDLAITPSQETVFFECNPEGMWLWLDRYLKGLISAMVAATSPHFSVAP